MGERATLCATGLSHTHGRTGSTLRNRCLSPMGERATLCADGVHTWENGPHSAQTVYNLRENGPHSAQTVHQPWGEAPLCADGVPTMGRETPSAQPASLSP